MAERLGRALRAVGRARWIMAAVLGAAFVLWLVLFAPRLLVPAASPASLRDVTDAAKRHELQDSRLKLQNDVRTTLLQGLGGLAVVVGAFYTYRQVQTNRRQLEHTIESSRQQHELDQQGQITERFTRAIDQLGHAQLDVRLGGIYALERIARDSPADRSTIGEVLTAFVRSHAPWPPRLPGQYVATASIDEVPELQVRAADVQASLTVLGRGGFADPKPQGGRLDLHAVDLRRATLANAHLEGVFLHGVHLEDAHLGDAHLEGAFLALAHLEGAFLGGAKLEGVNLYRAHLRKANLEGAHLERALLGHANLEEANLERAHLEQALLGHANLARARLAGAWFSDSHLDEADLRGAHLEGAILGHANLELANLDGAHLELAILDSAHLEDANLRGAYLEGAILDGAHLEDANLRGARLEGAKLRHANLWGAVADWNTGWPGGFDWRAARIVIEDEDTAASPPEQA